MRVAISIFASSEKRVVCDIRAALTLNRCLNARFILELSHASIKLAIGINKHAVAKASKTKPIYSLVEGVGKNTSFW